MLLVGKPRGLDDTKTYPCSVKDVRGIFASAKISVGFGITAKYSFDTSARHCPKLRGVVAASISINRRMPIEIREGHLRFYAVDKASFDKTAQSLFCAKYLPLLYEWYCQNEKEQLIGGICQLLIEWDNGDFRVHEMKYI